MKPRISPAEPPFSSAVQEKFDQLMPKGIPPLKLFTMLARDERLFSRFMGGGLLDKGHLSMRHREIIIDRVTAQCGSEYEWGVHVAFFAERVKFSKDQTYSLVHGSADDPCWNVETERNLIRACDQLHVDCTIKDALWNDLRADFIEEALLEITMLAGFYRTVSYLTNVAKLPTEEFAAKFPAA